LADHDRVLELALSSTVWPFTEPASRRIQIGADGAAEPEIEGAWVVRVLIRGLQPGPEERACLRLPLPSARGVTIRRSKTDQEGAGAVVAVCRGSIACPVAAVKEWLARGRRWPHSRS
jgi:hypothetical protein